MKFLRRCWNGLKGLVSRKPKQIDNTPVITIESTVVEDTLTEAGTALLRTAHEVRVEAKRLARANLAHNPRVDRKSFLRLLEAETDRMIRQLITIAGTQECAA